MGTVRCVGQIQSEVGRAVLGHSVPLARLGVLDDPGRSWAFLGGLWALGAVLERSGRRPGAVLARPWGAPGRSWGVLGASEPVLAGLGAVLRAPRGRFSAVVWPSGEL